MEEKFLEFIFEKMEDSDKFKFKSKELSRLKFSRQNQRKLLDNYISKRVHPQSSLELINLIDEYKDSIQDFDQCESKMYFIKGFEVAFDFFMSLSQR